MDKKPVEELVIRDGVEKLALLDAISRVNNVQSVLLNALVENNFTFEEAIAVLDGFRKGFAEVIEENPSKRTELLKKENTNSMDTVERYKKLIQKDGINSKFKTTVELHEELVKREGVTEIVIGPYEKIQIVQDQRTHEFTGPARVLVNQD